MRVIADENFPGDAVSTLRERGHDVVWVRTDMPASSDTRILERAQTEARIVMTFDKDFGELAFRFGLPASSGVILFRITAVSSEYVTRMVSTALESRADWTGQFAVVEESRIRLTPLPDIEGKGS
jgi:predicted nuclease of predicted toxin-antitoxin system